jgi:aminoglycoside phosphotransferase (APT) family kinase protein
MAERLTTVGERPAVFLHGDWHAGNYLSDEQGVTAVLDWEEAALGDPRFDVANADAEMRRRTPVLADHFRYQYEARAGFTVGDLRIWIDLAYLRSRIMSAFVNHRLAQGQRLPSLNPEDWIPDTWIDK